MRPRQSQLLMEGSMSLRRKAPARRAAKPTVSMEVGSRGARGGVTPPATWAAWVIGSANVDTAVTGDLVFMRTHYHVRLGFQSTIFGRPSVGVARKGIRRERDGN